MSTLNKHHISDHGLSFKTSKSSLEPRELTRNNSLVEEQEKGVTEKLLNEDLSLDECIIKNGKIITNEIVDIEVSTNTNNKIVNKEGNKEEIENEVVKTEGNKSKDEELKKQDVEDHYQLPKIETLHSCLECDFDTEEIEDVKRHEEQNIHDIQHQDRTKIKKLDISVKLEEFIFICYLCKFIAKSRRIWKSML